MPTHSIQGAVAALFEVDGAPWNFPAWISLTGVKNGLFPKNDKDLPNGWTREDATLVEAYFITYLKLKTETQRLCAASSRTGNVAGRDIWRKWLSRCWKEWDVHSIISKCLTDAKLHPLQIALAAKNSPVNATKSLHSKAHPLNLPVESNLLLQLVIETAGLALFGPEAFDDDTDRIIYALRAPFTVLVQRCWINNKNVIIRDTQKMAKLEIQATEAFNSEHIHLYRTHGLT